jgi:hypothetical protein
MTAVTALLHRAARSGVTIYFDHDRGCSVMWSYATPPTGLIEALCTARKF